MSAFRVVTPGDFDAIASFIVKENGFNLSLGKVCPATIIPPADDN